MNENRVRTSGGDRYGVFPAGLPVQWQRRMGADYAAAPGRLSTTHRQGGDVLSQPGAVPVQSAGGEACAG